MSDAPQAIEQIFGMPKVFKKTKKREKKNTQGMQENTEKKYNYKSI